MKYTKPLKENYNFKKILKRGVFLKGNYINVYIMPNNENINYLGICVSKKNGNSVIRNRLKRWVRESYKNIETKIEKNKNIIVLFKKNTIGKNMNFKIIDYEIKTLFKEAKILNEKRN